MSNIKSVPENVSIPAPLEELEFRGGPNEDVSNFLGAIKRAAVKQGRHSDNQWMASYTESCLRGDAMGWFDEMGPDVATIDWTSLRRAFLRQFRAAPPPLAAGTGTEEMAAVATELTAAVKKATGARKAKAATATDAAAAAEVAASAEAANRAATVASRRAAAAAATATAAAAEIQAAVEKVTAAVTAATAAAASAAVSASETATAAASRRPVVPEAATAPFSATVDSMFGDVKAKFLQKTLILGNSDT
ncbi:hypothetical protein FRB93_008729, partial [Tulasnella sp. JGI-2019a]